MSKVLRPLRHVRISNFKSISELDIELKPLTIFIGPNASDKSNILHAIALMSLKGKYNPSFRECVSDVEKQLYRVDSYEDLV